MTNSRSPLKDKPLRNPGQSIRRQLVDIVFDKLIGPLLVLSVLVTWALIEWMRYLWPATQAPWMQLVVALAAAAYFGFQFRRVWPQLRALRLAEDGEKYVGQLLEELRVSGYSVFHDVMGEEFNVDHVIIGPGGIFTVETKTWSKPLRGSPEISFDGDVLKAAGYTPDRDPIVQAKAQTAWLTRLLTGSTGKPVSVRPVVLFPGWYIKDSRKNRRDLWVLEPKVLPKWLANERAVLAPDEIAMASAHLSRYIQFQERLLDEAS